MLALCDQLDSCHFFTPLSQYHHITAEPSVMKVELSSPPTGGPGHVTLWLAFANGMIPNMKRIPRLKTHVHGLACPCV